MPTLAPGRDRSRRLAAALLVAAAFVIPAASPAAAGLASHSGEPGVHTLIDSPEYPAIICHYDTSFPGAIHRIAFRRPIIYAPNVSSLRDQRWVGWRFRIQRSSDGTSWQGVFRSPIARAIAYDDQPAVLQPRGRDVVGQSGYAYRGVVDMWWYTPGGSSTTTGKASHTTLYGLMVVDSFESPVSGPCTGQLGPKPVTARIGPTVEPAGEPHAGNPGLHTPIDTPFEYPGVACVYQGGELRTLKVRAPVVFAQDTYIGAQGVRWRFVVQAESGGPPTIVHTSTWTNSAATEDRAARWTPRRSLTVDGSDWDRWIVTIEMQWLGVGTPRPSAVHGLYHGKGGVPLGYCTATNP